MDTCNDRRSRARHKHRPYFFCFLVFYLGIVCISPVVRSADIRTVSRTCAISSPHPYSSFADLSWPIAEYGAQALRVQFSRLEVEDGYDFVYLNSSLEATSLTGSYPSGCWSAWVAGSTFTLRLTSNSYNTDYGFDAVAYEVQVVQAWEPFLIVAIPSMVAIVIVFITLRQYHQREEREIERERLERKASKHK